MSLFVKIKNWLSGNGFERDSRIRSSEFIKALIGEYVCLWDEGCDSDNIFMSDRYRMILTYRNFERYADKYHPAGQLMIYGEIAAPGIEGDSVPDCDEFADEAMYFLGVKGLMAEYLLSAPAVGIISYYSMSLQTWHRANIVILIDKRTSTPYIYEPQTGKIKDFLQEVGKVRWVKI